MFLLILFLLFILIAIKKQMRYIKKAKNKKRYPKIEILSKITFVLNKIEKPSGKIFN